MRTAMLCLAVLAVLTAPTVARAIDAQEAGEMNAEIESKEKAVKEKYGNRPYKELSQDERKAYAQEVQDARESTLKDHNTSSKDFEKAKVKLGHDGLTKSEEAKKGWGEKQAQKKAAAEEAKKAEDAKKAETKDGEVKVIKGFDEKNPGAMDEKKNEGTEIPLPKGGNDAPPPQK
jgi:hypothetical protein